MFLTGCLGQFDPYTEKYTDRHRNMHAQTKTCTHAHSIIHRNQSPTLTHTHIHTHREREREKWSAAIHKSQCNSSLLAAVDECFPPTREQDCGSVLISSSWVKVKPIILFSLSIPHWLCLITLWRKTTLLPNGWFKRNRRVFNIDTYNSDCAVTTSTPWGWKHQKTKYGSYN